MKTHCHEILFCKTMLDIVDHFRPIIPAIDSKAISIVPQLSKCLKFEAVWGVLTDQMI